jgi:hypothetical protein
MELFFLAILVSFMIKWTSTLVIIHYVNKYQDEEEIMSKLGFNIAVISQLIAQGIMYVSATVFVALVVKEHIL